MDRRPGPTLRELMEITLRSNPPPRRPSQARPQASACGIPDGPPWYAAENSRRRARRLARATPTWADLAAIAAVYAQAGGGVHVDHIIPLAGRLVSGLHVAANLRAIPARENLVKSARFDPDTFEGP